MCNHFVLLVVGQKTCTVMEWDEVGLGGWCVLGVLVSKLIYGG